MAPCLPVTFSFLSIPVTVLAAPSSVPPAGHRSLGKFQMESQMNTQNLDFKIFLLRKSENRQDY